MHKRLINALIFMTAGSLGLSAFILPPQARSQETTQSCEIALLNAKNRIEQGREITVEIDITDGSEEYPDHPDGRPTIIWLIVEGNAAESVMESPVFQKAIASEIINSCNSVGAVSFRRYQTGWINTIGLMKDGTIQKFARSCVTWEQAKSEVESLYYDHPLPELPDGFKNGCVFGDNGAYIIAISVFKEGMRPPITQANDTFFGTSILKFSSIDPEYAMDENWDSLRFYNVCGSVGTAATNFCQTMPTDEVFIKEGLVCHNYLCIEADKKLQSELVRLWNEALEHQGF